MVECIFTIDYEIYGDGTGSLAELVYEPAERLKDVFNEWNARFVTFVEAIEFEKIEEFGTDPAIGAVKKQIRQLHREGFEIALHLHPQWANARREEGKWVLDRTEYNLCTLPESRILEIVDNSLGYLGHVVDASDFHPLSFRAGNWLFQPTRTAARVLYERGLRVDSSVFKGGRQRNHGLDYRGVQGSQDHYWTFKDDVAVPDSTGEFLELPIHTDQVPAWKMLTAKRVSYGNSFGGGQTRKQKLNRVLDFMRFRYPLKFDFCRMNIDELRSMMERVIQEDRIRPEIYRPIVAIGHTKDLTDFSTIKAFLSFLKTAGIAVTTLEAACLNVNRSTPLLSTR
jgi:hypothetical protein